MEEERGIEALVYLPVTEVLLPMEQAIELLAKRTYKSVEKNIDRLINELKERGDHTSARTMELNKYSALADMSSGGYSMEGSEVAYIFENMNQY